MTSSFECEHCNEIFQSKKNLRKHIQSHNVDPPHLSKESHNKRYERGLCVINFETGEEMNNHMDDRHGGR